MGNTQAPKNPTWQKAVQAYRKTKKNSESRNFVTTTLTEQDRSSISNVGHASKNRRQIYPVVDCQEQMMKENIVKQEQSHTVSFKKSDEYSMVSNITIESPDSKFSGQGNLMETRKKGLDLDSAALDTALECEKNILKEKINLDLSATVLRKGHRHRKTNSQLSETQDKSLLNFYRQEILKEEESVSEETARDKASHSHSPFAEMQEHIEGEAYEVFKMNIKACTEKFGNFIYDAKDTDNGPLRVYKFPDTQEVYRGQWKDNKRNGRGDQVWPDGSVYQGYWKSDMRNGRGRYVSKDGEIYEGQWKNDMFHGKGKYVYSTGRIYDGGWHENKKHGFCSEVYPDGTMYEGRYAMGCKEGLSKQVWADGSAYIGDFARDRLNGYGILNWSDGRKYEGEWKDSYMHGKGEFVWADGKKYKGQYVNNMKHGYGEFEWPDKVVYKGNFVNNKIHGEGMYVTPDRIVRGIWHEGNLLKWM